MKISPETYVADLVIRIRSAWKTKGALFFMPSLRMDDSGHEDSTKVFVAAGYVAPVEAWNAFELEWERIAKGKTLKMSHLCGASGHGEFQNWGTRERGEFVSAMGRTIDRHLNQGVARALIVADYKTYLLPETETFLRGTDAARLAAIAWTLRMSMEWVAVSWPDLPDKQKIDLIFEEGTKGLTPALTYCRNLKRSKEWARVFGHIGTDSKESLISLQASDFLAYHVYQHYEAERRGIKYEWPESFKLSIQSCNVNLGLMTKEEMPDMIETFRLLDLLGEHPV